MDPVRDRCRGRIPAISKPVVARFARTTGYRLSRHPAAFAPLTRQEPEQKSAPPEILTARCREPQD